MDDEVATGKRITLKRRRPNPLFQEWLEELHSEAKAKKSKLEGMLNEALSSLSKYPLPLKSGADCLILKGFDRKLCTYLDRNLDRYKSNDLTEPLTDSSESQAQLANSSQQQAQHNGSLPQKQNTNGSHLQSQHTFGSQPQTLSENADIGTSSQHRTISMSSNTSSQESINPQNHPTSTNNLNSETFHTRSRKQKKSPKDRKVYKPVFRSGSYAILIALLEHSKDSSNQALKKDELIDKAQKYSEESFVRPKPESFYTAWSNMSTLVKKGLVTQTRGKKAQYSLTEQGTLLAAELLEETKNKPTMNNIIFNGDAVSNDDEIVVLEPENSRSTTDMFEIDGQVNLQRTDSEIKFIDLSAGCFDVVLLIDKQETGGVSKRNDPTVAQFNKYPLLKHEYRSLKVGDFTWIARNKANKDEELVLPYIVERKRMDDLGASIKDGRFHEQKFRLRKCGLKNVIYLVENYGSNSHVGLPIQSLRQALANTRVQDGFKVHVTDNLSNSARFLAMMTKRLTVEYKDKHLIGCNRESQGSQLMTFNYFNKSSIKNKPLTVTETFIKLLLQLKGVSVEKALAITKVYNTPRLLAEEYEKCNKKEGEMLLASLKHGDLNRNVGPSASKSIYQFFVWDK